MEKILCSCGGKGGISCTRPNAREKSVTKKVVVIEKSIDKDGNVVQKKIVKEGEEADEYIKEMENEEKNVFIFKSDEDVESSVKVVKKQAYKIKTVDEEGNEKVVEWNGEGEMPSEIKEMVEKEGLHAKDHHESTGKIWIKKSINGEDTEIEVDIEDVVVVRSRP